LEDQGYKLCQGEDTEDAEKEKADGPFIVVLQLRVPSCGASIFNYFFLTKKS
jgi:hypothetical protein